MQLARCPRHVSSTSLADHMLADSSSLLAHASDKPVAVLLELQRCTCGIAMAQVAALLP
jgi:hypothetical protein